MKNTVSDLKKEYDSRMCSEYVRRCQGENYSKPTNNKFTKEVIKNEYNK